MKLTINKINVTVVHKTVLLLREYYLAYSYSGEVSLSGRKGSWVKYMSGKNEGTFYSFEENVFYPVEILIDKYNLTNDYPEISFALIKHAIKNKVNINTEFTIEEDNGVLKNIYYSKPIL